MQYNGDKRLANLKPFQPGQSGNPGGRPRALVTGELRRRLREDPTLAARLVDTLLARALAGDQRALGTILDRLEGRPCTWGEPPGRLVETFDRIIATALSFIPRPQYAEFLERVREAGGEAAD